MKDVIGNILDIENKANAIIEEGAKEKAALLEKMRIDIEKMQGDIDAMVDAKLEQLDKKEKEAAAQSLKRINASAEKKLQAMDEFYKANQDTWVDSVFNIVTGSDKSGS